MMLDFLCITDQASKMYKNVLGADVSGVLVSLVQNMLLLFSIP